MGIVILLVTFALMWVLFILPQQRRVKRHQAVVAALAVGDEVMTTSGMRGEITNLDDELVHLRIADGVVVRFARAAVAQRLGDELATGALGVADRDALDADSRVDEHGHEEHGDDELGSGDGPVSGAR
ncbi:hypothetical protein BH20ACT2_BH20ACT2_22530 [soil metagenome]